MLILGTLFLWRPLEADVSGARTAEDSINFGPEPRIRLVNDRGGVSVEGVEGLRSVDFEATKYAMGKDTDAARRNASEVSINVSREESAFVIETESNRNTGADYTMRAPKGSSLEVEAEAGRSG